MRIQQHVEGNEVRRVAAAVAQNSLRMTRFDRECSDHFHAVETVTRLRIPMAKRTKFVVIREKVGTEVAQVHSAVVGYTVDQVFRCDFRTDRFLKDPVELGDVLLAESQTDGHRVTAVARQKVRAFRENLDQIQTADAASGAVRFIALDRKDDRRTVVIAGKP